jgi:hypothetical protein
MNRLLLILFVFATGSVFGQDEIVLYRKIYKTADSLKAVGQLLNVDTTSVFRKAFELDNQHPSKYFESTGGYLERSKFNEASLLYYIGLIRYGYYNSANPKYQASNDGALLASLRYGLGEPIHMYLRTDVENFISIVKLSIDYCKKNDFKFFGRNNDVDKYTAQIQSFDDLVTELNKNKDKYKNEWLIEKKTMEERLNRMVEEKLRKKN